MIAPLVYGFGVFFETPVLGESFKYLNLYFLKGSFVCYIYAISIAAIECRWFILTSRDFTPKGSLVGSSCYFRHIQVVRV